MRFILIGLLLAWLCGCGPNRKVEKGSVVITAVETIPVEQQKMIPPQPGKTNK